MELTPKQAKALDFIRDYIDQHQSPPTLREIGAALKVSVGTAQDHLRALIKKGFINAEQGRSRGLRLPGEQGILPILGRVFAGSLHSAYEEAEGSIDVGKAFRSRDHFALRVRGDSMIDAGIFEGDIVIVRSQPTAVPGDIVVARKEDEATVKYLRRNAGTLILEPANEAYSPIPGPFEIIGVVVELRRHLDRS